MGDFIDLTSPLPGQAQHSPADQATVDLLSDSDEEKRDPPVVPSCLETAHEDLSVHEPPWPRAAQKLKKVFREASTDVGKSAVAEGIGLAAPSIIDVELEEYIKGRGAGRVCENRASPARTNDEGASVWPGRVPTANDHVGLSDDYRKDDEAGSVFGMAKQPDVQPDGEGECGVEPSLDSPIKGVLQRQREGARVSPFHDVDPVPTPSVAERTVKNYGHQKVAKSVGKERTKMRREEMKLAKMKEKKALAEEKERLRKLKGTDCLKKIRVLISKTVATRTLGPQVLIRLKEAEYDYMIEPLPMEDKPCFCWERYVPFELDSDMLGERHKRQKRMSDGKGNVMAVPYILFTFEAEEFVEEILADRLDGFLKSVAKHHPDCTLAIMTVGLDRYLTNRERREFQQNGPAMGGFQRHGIDDFVARLTTHYPGIRYRAPLDLAEASELVVDLTTNLARQFYWPLPNFLTRFGGSVDKSISGVLKSDMAKALHTVPGLGPNHALTIEASYPSLGALLERYTNDSCDNASNSMMVANLTLPNGRRVGPQVSKRLFHFLTTEDGGKIIE